MCCGPASYLWCFWHMVWEFLGLIQTLPRQAFIELNTEEAANTMVSYYTTVTPILRGQGIYIQFSNHKELKTDNSPNQAVSNAWCHPWLCLFGMSPHPSGSSKRLLDIPSCRSQHSGVRLFDLQAWDMTEGVMSFMLVQLGMKQWHSLDLLAREMNGVDEHFRLAEEGCASSKERGIFEGGAQIAIQDQTRGSSWPSRKLIGWRGMIQ